MRSVLRCGSRSTRCIICRRRGTGCTCGCGIRCRRRIIGFGRCRRGIARCGRRFCGGIVRRRSCCRCCPRRGVCHCRRCYGTFGCCRRRLRRILGRLCGLIRFGCSLRGRTSQLFDLLRCKIVIRHAERTFSRIFVADEPVAVFADVGRDAVIAARSCKIHIDPDTWCMQRNDGLRRAAQHCAGCRPLAQDFDRSIEAHAHERIMQQPYPDRCRARRQRSRVFSREVTQEHSACRLRNVDRPFCRLFHEVYSHCRRCDVYFHIIPRQIENLSLFARLEPQDYGLTGVDISSLFHNRYFPNGQLVVLYRRASDPSSVTSATTSPGTCCSTYSMKSFNRSS